jgi:hypothetical protein
MRDALSSELPAAIECHHCGDTGACGCDLAWCPTCAGDGRVAYCRCWDCGGGGVLDIEEAERIEAREAQASADARWRPGYGEPEVWR